MKDSKTTKEDLLVQRYGRQSVPENIIWNKQIEELLSHRSVRKYLPDPIPEGAIETIVAAAQSASNSSNLNQWSVIAVTDPVLKSQIAQTSRLNSKFGKGNPYIEQAPVFLLWVADMYRSNELSKNEDQNTPVHEFLDAFLMASIDTAIASQNAVVAAESLGLGAVYIGGMRNNAKEIAEMLELPDYTYVVFGMVLGIPDSSELSRIRPRLSQKAVLHYNGYNREKWIDEVKIYEDALHDFRVQNNMKMKTWKEDIIFSTSNMDYMDGREELRNTLEARGFKFQ